MWSFGILCWEVFMFGQQPFAGLANEEVLGIVTEGKRDPCARDSDLRCILPL